MEGVSPPPPLTDAPLRHPQPLKNSSPATDAVSLDLETITATQAHIVSALQDQVCQWEQNASDASSQDDNRTANLYRQWSFALDIALSVITRECLNLVVENARVFQISETRKVELPDLTRSVKDLAIDAMAIEVASEQPCPISKD